MILMLDFDGVLHPEPCRDPRLHFTRLPMLEGVVREFPHVEIVITSTWREQRNLEELRSIFSADIAHRVIGATPSCNDHVELAEAIGPTYRRSIEIEAYLRATGTPWSPWLALDDKPYWFRPFCKNLILCNPKMGITETTLDEMRKRISRVA